MNVVPNQAVSAYIRTTREGYWLIIMDEFSCREIDIELMRQAPCCQVDAVLWCYDNLFCVRFQEGEVRNGGVEHGPWPKSVRNINANTPVQNLSTA